MTRAEKKEYNRKHAIEHCEAKKKYRLENRARDRERLRKWRAANPHYDLNRSYGKGAPEHFQMRIKIQNHCCSICSVRFTKTPSLDHNHGTGQWRGALCQPWNALIGMAKEDTGTLRKAIEYLRFWKRK
jgi:Recombination endonuclease VII